MPTVFVSSASGDDDPYVAQFGSDLAAALGGEWDVSVGTIGTGVREWPAGMAHALATCDAFVAVTSQRYFLTEACGRQWQAVQQRIEDTPKGAPIMLALPWTTDAEIPAQAGKGVERVAVHPQRGLRSLARLRSLRPVYQALVADLARRLRGGTKAGALPVFADTPNAFGRPAQGSAPHVHLVVAAGTATEMVRVREQSGLRFYGATSADWRPYQPETGEPIAARARAVAAEHLLQSEIGTIDDVLEHIERARRAAEIVVVLVDWWVTKLDEYRQVLAEIDRRGLSETAVLVPTSPADEETNRNRDELQYALRWAFRHSAGGPNTPLRIDIDSPQRFDTELAGAIEAARNRIFRDGTVHHLASGEPPGERPILRGP